MLPWTSFLVALCSLLHTVHLGQAAANAQSQQVRVGCSQHPDELGDIYSFEEEDLFEKKNISLADFKGQVVLFVNVATY